MTRIVKHHVPASQLPKEWQEELGAAVKQVTVTVEEEAPPPAGIVTLEEIFAQRRPPFRSAEEIDAEIRTLRDEWDR